jgi:hypothetical protein
MHFVAVVLKNVKYGILVKQMKQRLDYFLAIKNTFGFYHDFGATFLVFWQD